MNEQKRKELLAVCEGATDGPWETFSGYWKNGEGNGRLPADNLEAVQLQGDPDLAVVFWTGFDASPYSPAQRRRNARHIATFDPPTVRGMLERIGELEDAIREAGPHDESCQLALSMRVSHPDLPRSEHPACNCWKADALEGSQ